MARLTHEGADALYAFHHRWLSDTLGQRDSLLTPGTSVWTVAHIAELDGCFANVATTVPGSGFLAKLEAQLHDRSSGAKQLVAEALVIYYLMVWNGAISAVTKRSRVEAVLSWMPHPPSIPRDVDAVFSPGLVHPGRFAMNRPDTQLDWILRFAGVWSQHREDPGDPLGDPWAMRRLAESVAASSGVHARLAMLHMSHPDVFEPIVSPQHRSAIVDRFAALGPDTDDVDRKLLGIRAALSAQYGDAFFWYGDPLLHRWLQNPKQWPAFQLWCERFRAMDDFDEAERTYKLDLQPRIVAARQAVLADADEWQDLSADPDQELPAGVEARGLGERTRRRRRW